MDATMDNIRRFFQHKEEKEMKIKELKEKLQQVRIHERSLSNFKANTEKVRNDIEGVIIDMYAKFHLFQNVVSTVIEQNNWILMQLMQYNTIREGIVDIDTWITKNIDVPPKLYRPTKSTRKTHIYVLDHFQQVEKRAYKEVIKAMGIYSKIKKLLKS